MIELLTDNDIGRWVYYIPRHAKDDKSQWERGKIKSFSNENQRAWVVYDTNGNWDGDHWKDYTGAATGYDDIIFVEVEND